MVRVSVIGFIVGFLILTGCGGNQTNDQSNEKKNSSAMEDGKSTYLKYCLACHQTDGNGVPGMYPPLKNSDWLTKDKETLIRLVLEGKSGKITVNGVDYNQVMPRQNFLTDEQIAGVLSYIRKEMGNVSDSITSLEVSKVRADKP